ncbi:MAG: CHASE3 domain-containing protein [bacterium]
MKVTLEYKIRFQYVFSLILIIIVGVVSLYSINDLEEHTALVKQTQEIQTNLSILLSAITDAETGQRGFVISGDERFLEPYKQSGPKIFNSIHILEDLVSDSFQKTRLNAVAPLIIRRNVSIQSIIRIRNIKGFQAAEKEISNGQGRQIQDSIRFKIHDMQVYENFLLKERAEKADKSIMFAKVIIISSIVLMILFICFSFFITYVGFSKLRKAETDINNLNETLEQHVAERTSQLVVINKELKFHLSELEQFSYVSNHDLQEPLRTINQFIQLFYEKYAGTLDEDGEKYIEFISKSAVRMNLLVKSLLDYSLLGKSSTTALVDCNKIVELVLGDLDESIKGNSAKMTIRELPSVNGFETELRLLFQNLIGNAIKYHKPGIVPEIQISAENHEKEWLFSIKDNGIGIDKKHNEKIFIIFQRLHNRYEFEGSGIGLAHCKKIVELHGGKIWVESNIEGGSTFKFTIPLST